MTPNEFLGWLGFAVVAGGNIATFAFLIGKISATGATMTKAVDDIRMDFNAFRSEVTSRLDVLNTTMADESKHNARLAERVDRHKERLDDLDRKHSRSIPHVK